MVPIVFKILTFYWCEIHKLENTYSLADEKWVKVYYIVSYDAGSIGDRGVMLSVHIQYTNK
jgi:hypothetical protein